VLVLTRKRNEEIVIDGNIIIRVVDIDYNNIKLGVIAPKDIRVDREEIHIERNK
jgi:carbon storage regulator